MHADLRAQYIAVRNMGEHTGATAQAVPPPQKWHKRKPRTVCEKWVAANACWRAISKADLLVSDVPYRIVTMFCLRYSEPGGVSRAKSTGVRAGAHFGAVRQLLNHAQPAPDSRAARGTTCHVHDIQHASGCGRQKPPQVRARATRRLRQSVTVQRKCHKHAVDPPMMGIICSQHSASSLNFSSEARRLSSRESTAAAAAPAPAPAPAPALAEGAAPLRACFLAAGDPLEASARPRFVLADILTWVA